MKFIIDSIEGKYAVVELEDGNVVDISLSLIPEDAKEGDVLEIRVMKGETLKRKERIDKMCEGLWE